MLNEKVESVIVRYRQKPTGLAASLFKKDYVIIFMDRPKLYKLYFQAYTMELGFESNLSEQYIMEETKPVSKREADNFVKYVVDLERDNYNINLKIVEDIWDTTRKRVGKFKDFLDL